MSRPLEQRQRNAMTVDVEDYFQVQAFANCIDRNTWDSFASHVEANTNRILEQFANKQVRATFFTLGWVAERFPRLIREIVENGHELASHGYGHQLVHSLTPAAFREDVAKARGLLEQVGGEKVIGYRAPTFSIGPQTPWAFNILAETGHKYSSSVYPVKHDLYGAPGSSRAPYHPSKAAVLELPLTTLLVGGRAFPIAGGGYFRIAPYWLYRAALKRFNEKEKRPSIFYFHPWEIDTNQPRIQGASRLSSFRHLVNVNKMSGRLEYLLRDFAWGRMDEVFATDLAASSA